MKKIKTLIEKLKLLDEEYNIILSSSALAFYFIIMVFSIAIIIIYTVTNLKALEPFLLSKILDIFTENFSETVIKMLPSFSSNTNIIIYIIVMIWSSSEVIYIINKICDNIYKDIKRRNVLRNRISAFFMLCMLIFIVVFLFFITSYINYFLDLFITSVYAQTIIRMILEFSVIYIGILLLFVYSPPERKRFRESLFESFIVSLIIYLLFGVYLLIIKIYKIISLASFLVSLVSLTFLFVYFISYVFISGLIFDYMTKEKHTKN